MLGRGRKGLDDFVDHNDNLFRLASRLTYNGGNPALYQRQPVATP